MLEMKGDGRCVIQRATGQVGLVPLSSLLESSETGVELRMVDKHLTDVPPVHFFFPHVQHISLSGNAFTAFPVLKWQDIVTLQLDYCKISSFDPGWSDSTQYQLVGSSLTRYPIGIASLTPSTLVELTLDHNHLTEVPESLGTHD
jgi:hypothetical protein